MTLTPIAEDTRTPAGNTVASLVSAFIQDNDPAAVKGVAIVGLTGSDTGSWQYSLNGGLTWLPLVEVSPARARLLRDTAKLRYVPAANFFGQAALEYRAWDQTVGAVGGTFDLSAPAATGGATAFSTVKDLVFALVNSVNDRPVLDPGGQLWLSGVLPGTVEPDGNTVAELLGGSITDIDPQARQGIAVVAAPAIGGHWDYLLPGQNWQRIGTVSSTNVLLLRPDDRVRFVPNPGFAGVARLTYRAWDQTGTPVAIGTSTAFSLASETANVLVSASLPAVNRAPTLDTAGTPTLTPIAEDSLPGRGDTVEMLLGTAFADADPNSLRGVAITALGGTTPGTWHYSLNAGRTWVAATAVSPANALLLRNTDRLRFVPRANSHGTADVTYRAWDRTRGTAGGRANLELPGVTGGASAFSVAEQAETATLLITGMNDRPVLDTTGTPRLTPILPGTSNPAGDLVSTLLGSAVRDVDDEALAGMAVTAAVSSPGTGTWFYQRPGQEWTAIGTVSNTAMLLLRPEDRLRFVPKPGFAGVVTLAFRAWDQSMPLDVTDKVALTATGTACSTATELATLTVNAVNDRPILNTRGIPMLPPVLPDTPGIGVTVASLLGALVSDPDDGALTGMAVTGASTTGGRWQYSIDGGTSWEDLLPPGAIPLSARAAFLLRGQDLLRFVPTTGFRGTASLTCRAWDQSDGRAPGGRADTTLATATAYSLASEVVMVVVNTAPRLPE